MRIGDEGDLPEEKPPHSLIAFVTLLVIVLMVVDMLVNRR